MGVLSLTRFSVAVGGVECAAVRTYKDWVMYPFDTVSHLLSRLTIPRHPQAEIHSSYAVGSSRSQADRAFCLFVRVQELQAARVDYLHFALDRLHRLEEQRAAIAHRSSGGESSNNNNRGGGNNNQGQGGGKGGASRGAAAREEEEAALREEEAGRTEAMYRVRQGA